MGSLGYEPSGFVKFFPSVSMCRFREGPGLRDLPRPRAGRLFPRALRGEGGVARPRRIRAEPPRRERRGVFEGDRSVIEACIEWNRGSQPYAQVTDVEISWTAPRGDPKGFHVRHS